ncbi:MAG: hypothetical protein COA69_09820 [Robiginitomaculum sp.]|nr:MAG: hypothetical protein COA69_09820 [Robiginitomaculum sp.]
MPKQDECLILIKANPHLSSSHFETVCCAGIGRDGKWRRQYPISFRILDDKQKFQRWSWIKYDFIEPKNDTRKESQKVQDNSIEIIGKASQAERTRCLEHLIFKNFKRPEAEQDSLTLIRPTMSEFYWKPKTPEDIAKLAKKHAGVVSQGSLFHADARPLIQCPYSFHIKWLDDLGVSHDSTCDDWETSATFFVRRKTLKSDDLALQSMAQTFNVDYPKKGMAMAFSTHSRRHWQWLLVGLLRADHIEQQSLF